MFEIKLFVALKVSEVNSKVGDIIEKAKYFIALTVGVIRAKINIKDIIIKINKILLAFL